MVFKRYLCIRLMFSASMLLFTGIGCSDDQSENQSGQARSETDGSKIVTEQETQANVNDRDNTMDDGKSRALSEEQSAIEKVIGDEDVGNDNLVPPSVDSLNTSAADPLDPLSFAPGFWTGIAGGAVGPGCGFNGIGPWPVLGPIPWFLAVPIMNVDDDDDHHRRSAPKKKHTKRCRHPEKSSCGQGGNSHVSADDQDDFDWKK